MDEEEPNLVLFSGGTAFNKMAKQLNTKVTSKVTHVLPVSDDGGSTAEIVRILGGPAVGDIRSRCLRLSSSSCAEARQVTKLLGWRLHKSNLQTAKKEWHEILEGECDVWNGISDPYKHTIRSFLVHFHYHILTHDNARFNWCNGSIGNFFFSGARIFFNSIEAAVFLYSRVSGIPNNSSVLPSIRTNTTQILSAKLKDGSIICGQSNISHPATSTIVDKNNIEALPSKIDRIFYSSLDAYKQEIFPVLNKAVGEKIKSADGILYCMGSLYTSIMPSLILQGAGEAVAEKNVPKIMLLNASNDRETNGMTAFDFVIAIRDGFNRINTPNQLNNKVNHYITVLLYPLNTSIEMNKDLFLEECVQAIGVPSVQQEDGNYYFDREVLLEKIKSLL